jgi:phenylacetate-CoA ligase
MSPVFDPLRQGAVAWDILQAGSGGAAGIAERQKTRLAALLEVARNDSAFYRRHLGRDLRADTPLDALPVVTRHELMQDFDGWVTDPHIRRAQLRSLTADPSRIGESFLERYLVWESSGTSSEPGVFVQDARALAVYDALEALRRSTPRPLQRWLDPLLLGERIAFVGATGGHFASFVSVQRLRQLNPWMSRSLRCFTIAQSAESLARELNAFAPTIVATYPTAAAMLCGEVELGTLDLHLREIWTGGENLGYAVRMLVERTFGCPLRNSYGASEFLSIGWECNAGSLHSNADWVILEPVDRQHRPVPPGVPGHTTLLTNLANHVQPLIRYDIGDRVTVAAQACRCGSPLPVIEVQGRDDDALQMAGLHGRAVTLLPLALTTVLEDDAGVFHFQLRQRDAHTLVLRLGLHGAPAQAAMARCRRALQRFVSSQGLMPVKLIDESSHPVPMGRSGKFRRVVAAAH